MPSDNIRSVPVRRLSHPVGDNSFLRILGSALSNAVVVVLSLPILLAFLVVLTACMSVRFLLLFIHFNKQGYWSSSGPESVRVNDRRWLGTAWRSSVIHAVLIFESKEGVNVDHFRRLLLKRVIPFYPRFTQRLIFLPISAGVRNCWLTDSTFSIDDHVFSGPSFLTCEKDLQDYVSKLIEDGLPEDKPPWQLQIFQSFGESKDTVVVMRVHQCVADGTALMRLLCHSLADSQTAEIPERRRFGSLSFCINVFRACLIGPLTLILWFFLSGEDCNVLTHRSGWTGSVTVTWSASITLPKVVRIKQVTRSTVNCVLLSALAGAIRRLLQRRGVKQPPNLKIVVPVDLREETGTVKTRLGNKTSSVTMPLPVAMEGCIPRLWATRKTLDSLKSSADPVILYVAVAALMSVGSASLARHLVNSIAEKASVQFACLPGPTSEISMEGQTLKGIYSILPAQANLGISVTTMTYADQIFVSVIAERALGPAAELILEYLEDQIEVLWKLLLNRRVPGEYETSTFATRIESPVKEIKNRLKLVQKEVERLSEGKDSDKDGKLFTLRAEFSELMGELKRRQSISETEEVDPPSQPQKPFSQTTFKKQSSDSPKPIHQSFNIQSKQETAEKNKLWHDYKKPESPLKNVDGNSKINPDSSKDCIISIPENKSGISAQASKSSNQAFDRLSHKPMSDLVSEIPKRTNMRPKSGRSGKPHKSYNSIRSSGEEFSESGEDVSSKFESNISKHVELNGVKCDKNTLELGKMEEKLFQVPYNLYGFKLDDKFEELEESDGVLI